jgi:hypothetical protein
VVGDGTWRTVTDIEYRETEISKSFQVDYHAVLCRLQVALNSSLDVRISQGLGEPVRSARPQREHQHHKKHHTSCTIRATRLFRYLQEAQLF